MLTATDYLLAWAIYLLSATVVMLAAWRITRPLWSWLRDLVRVALAVLVLVPAAAEQSGEHLAPALFVAAFELLTVDGGGMGPLLGVRLLLILIFAVLGVWSLRLLSHWLLGSRGGRAGR